MRNPLNLKKSLDKRKSQSSLRTLCSNKPSVDFSSNDYLGFAASQTIFDHTNHILRDNHLSLNGATGSRLLTGNHKLFGVVETMLENFHEAEAALIYNSGYDANIGFLSTVPRRGDVILYDELVHASIREGVALSNSRAYKFAHNNVEDLKNKILKLKQNAALGDVYIVTESVFSMDGNVPHLKDFANLSEAEGCFLIVDEAHALGVFGEKGEGIVQHLKIQDQVFARIVTFGKAIGCHGAAILGSGLLKQYLVNFSRSFIYTTALPPHSIAGIIAAYAQLELQKEKDSALLLLKQNIQFFQQEIGKSKLESSFLKSDSAIQGFIIPGNTAARQLALCLQENGYNVKSILAPTVQEGKERLRICIHSFNTQLQIRELVDIIVNNK